MVAAKRILPGRPAGFFIKSLRMKKKKTGEDIALTGDKDRRSKEKAAPIEDGKDMTDQKPDGVRERESAEEKESEEHLGSGGAFEATEAGLAEGRDDE
jgi:hypothetical protein